jgi:hypothetical protein
MYELIHRFERVKLVIGSLGISAQKYLYPSKRYIYKKYYIHSPKPLLSSSFWKEGYK